MNNPHPFRAIREQNRPRRRAVLLRFSPENSAHTAAGGRSTAHRLVKITSLNLRGEILWRKLRLVIFTSLWAVERPPAAVCALFSGEKRSNTARRLGLFCSRIARKG